MRQSSKLSIVILFLACTQSGPAFAYLDAGTGSLIVQLLLGGIVGVAATVKLYWYRLRQYFSKAPMGDEPKAADGEKAEG